MSDDSQRIDKWLWYARFFKTRTAATKFVAAGKVRVNKTRVTKAGQVVQVGDILTFTLHHRLRIVEILGAGTRRGPARKRKRSMPISARRSSRPAHRRPTARAPHRSAATSAAAGRPRNSAAISNGSCPAGTGAMKTNPTERKNGGELPN